MPTRLYLDTARLGRMSRGAQLAHIDFIRLAAEEAGSLHFDDFLTFGAASCGSEFARRYPGLSSWKDVADLKRDLKRLAGARDDSRLLLANRSAQLMRFTARIFFGPCRNVLVTDLSWPSYENILRRQAAQSGNRISQVCLRNAIYQDRLSAADCVERLTTAFIAGRCDGLFLPAVDNHGVRLPLEDIVREINRKAELRFVVADGAQAFCHAPLNLDRDFCDLYVAGCHKWLGACHPMGLAFYGRPRSRDYIETTLRRLLASGDLDDPLLSFTEELQRGCRSPFGETVNLASLFSCRGAVDDALKTTGESNARFSSRLANAAELARAAADAGWIARRPNTDLRSAILLLASPEPRVRSMEPDMLRRRLLDFGVAATAYRHGRVRFSMPADAWRTAELSLVISALRSFTDESSDSRVIRRQFSGEARPS